MWRIARVLLISLSLAGIGCTSYPDACSKGTSEKRTFEAHGTLTAGRVIALACAEHGGQMSGCGDDPYFVCCEFHPASEPWEGCEAYQSCCVARATPALLPVDGELPTLVELDCPGTKLAFALPDLRHREVGTFPLSVPVIEWDASAPAEPEAAARAQAWQADLEGQELALTVTVVEKTGAPRTSGERLATDDFAVRVQIDGTIPDAAFPDGPPGLAVSLELTQTAEDYADSGCD